MKIEISNKLISVLIILSIIISIISIVINLHIHSRMIEINNQITEYKTFIDNFLGFLK